MCLVDLMNHHFTSYTLMLVLLSSPRRELQLLFAFDIMQGSAKRLVKTALQEAAKKREMRYSDLKKIDRGVRRHFHDDITVIVVFLDSNLVSKATVKCSVRGGGISLPPNTLAPYTTTPTEAGNT